MKKRFDAQLQPLSDQELKAFEELKDVFEFLDDLIPLDGELDDDHSADQRKRYILTSYHTLFHKFDEYPGNRMPAAS